jgi:hypothetical protein
MQTTLQPIRPSTLNVWTGRIISALAVLFLLFDGAIKVLRLPPAVEATTQLGYAEHLVAGLGFLVLFCLALYVIPRTAVFGAVLLTGYLGGAVATHVSNGSPIFSMIFPLLLGAFIWVGLGLHDERVRKFL